MSAPAASQSIEYVYTKFDAKKCKHKRGTEVEDYGSWLCPGHEKLKVLLSAGDQRMYVTYGPWKKNNIAPSQTFPGFNSVYEGTVEWRIEKAAERQGASLRHHPALERGHACDREKATGPIKSTGRVLVVTRLGAGRHVPCRLCRRERQSGCQRAGAQDRRRERAHVQVRQGQTDRLRESPATLGMLPDSELVLPAERHLIEALRPEAFG